MITTRNPKVTVGLAVYNGEKYLGEAIDSVLAQTFRDFELVISDNASTDSTEEICRAYVARDARVRYFRAPQNRGAAWNFNHTLDLAQGEYVKWLAHDDVIGPDYLARTVEALDRDPALVVCHSRTDIIDSRGDLVHGDCSGNLAAFELQGTTPQSELVRLKTVGSPRPHRRFLGVLVYSVRCYEVFGLIRAAQMRKTGLRPYFSGEKVFLADLSLLGAFHEIPEVLSFSRWHPDRFSSNTSARAQSQHIDPFARRRLPLPRQCHATWGFVRSILHSDLNWRERIWCLTVLARFLLQVRKWKSVFVDYVRGMGQTAKLPEPAVAETRAVTGKRHWTSLTRPANASPEGSTRADLVSAVSSNPEI